MGDMVKGIPERISQRIDSLLTQGLVPDDVLDILKEEGSDPLPSMRGIRLRFKEYHESMEDEGAELDSAWF